MLRVVASPPLMKARARLTQGQHPAASPPSRSARCLSEMISTLMSESGRKRRRLDSSAVISRSISIRVEADDFLAAGTEDEDVGLADHLAEEVDAPRGARHGIGQQRRIGTRISCASSGRSTTTALFKAELHARRAPGPASVTRISEFAASAMRSSKPGMATGPMPEKPRQKERPAARRVRTFSCDDVHGQLRWLTASKRWMRRLACHRVVPGRSTRI